MMDAEKLKPIARLSLQRMYDHAVKLNMGIQHAKSSIHTELSILEGAPISKSAMISTIGVLQSHVIVPAKMYSGAFAHELDHYKQGYLVVIAWKMIVARKSFQFSSFKTSPTL